MQQYTKSKIIIRAAKDILFLLVVLVLCLYVALTAKASDVQLSWDCDETRHTGYRVYRLRAIDEPGAMDWLEAPVHIEINKEDAPPIIDNVGIGKWWYVVTCFNADDESGVSDAASFETALDAPFNILVIEIEK
ncbi:MAG: hypothetical protein SVM79_00060 [Chloroflexota bacterium]|nr:hypothetical protein [Chloroflexota bacterium]